MTTISPAAQAPFSADSWRHFWCAWEAGPQQPDEIQWLAQAVIASVLVVLSEAAPWWQTFWSAAPAPQAPEVPANANPLTVPQENQNDNASGAGYRECFSSSCAMLARYWGKVSSDDEFNTNRAKYGASTSAEAQLSAFRSLGPPPAPARDAGEALLAFIGLGAPFAQAWAVGS